MTYSRHVRRRKLKLKVALTKFLKDNGDAGISLTTDMWESKEQESFMSLTCHLITRDFKLLRVSPFCRHFGTKRHKSKNIAEELSKQVNSLHVDQEVPLVLVSDVAANMI